VNYYVEGGSTRRFATLNVRGDESSVPLHSQTYDNILRSLRSAATFFDIPDAKSLDFNDILYKGKFSVIDVAGSQGIQFGSILLRHLLKRIVDAKRLGQSSVPVLFVIDEVHQFYHTDASREALVDLDTICRTGRNQKIGVIFSSQNQEDIPKGLSNVINTSIYFRSDHISRNLFGVSSDEIRTLECGFAVANIHDSPHLQIVKFPLAFGGVLRND
jgi:DNA helicase HerA-like ATPase